MRMSGLSNSDASSIRVTIGQIESVCIPTNSYSYVIVTM